jgi:hypothetical protein
LVTVTVAKPSALLDPSRMLAVPAPTPTARKLLTVATDTLLLVNTALTRLVISVVKLPLPAWLKLAETRMADSCMRRRLGQVAGRIQPLIGRSSRPGQLDRHRQTREVRAHCDRA